jgi:acetyl esterase/lipase
MRGPPFPAAIDDCVAAFRSLLDNGIDPASIVFAGDSAGGGFTVTTCLATRDAGLPTPAAIEKSSNRWLPPLAFWARWPASGGSP